MGRWIDYMEIAITPKVKVRDIKKPKANNNAPKSIKGDYELYIHGNKIELFNQKDGMMVEAKCHPDDNFDIGEGIKEAFKKLEEEKKIKVGDWVEVIDNGASCSTKDKFFMKNNLFDYAARFRYGVSPNEGTRGKVLFVEENSDYEETTVVVEVPKESYCGSSRFANLDCYNAIYLIKIYGLRKVKKPL